MHECPECAMECDCDGEDHENAAAAEDCIHECDARDDDYSDYDEPLDSSPEAIDEIGDDEDRRMTRASRLPPHAFVISGRISGVTDTGFWLGHGAPRWSGDRDKFIPRSQIMRAWRGGKEIERLERSEAIERLELLEADEIEVGDEVEMEIPLWLAREKGLP